MYNKIRDVELSKPNSCKALKLRAINQKGMSHKKTVSTKHCFLILINIKLDIFLSSEAYTFENKCERYLKSGAKLYGKKAP